MEAVRWMWMKGWRWKSVAMGTESRISQRSILLPVRVRMDTAVTLSATPQRTPPPAALPHHSCECLCVSLYSVCFNLSFAFNNSLSQLHVQWRSRGLTGSEDLEESHHAGVAGRSQSQVSFSFILASAAVLCWALTCRRKCVVCVCHLLFCVSGMQVCFCSLCLMISPPVITALYTGIKMRLLLFWVCRSLWFSWCRKLEFNLVIQS